MTQTLNVTPNARNQKNAPILGITRSEQKLIRAALASVAGALKGKPAGAEAFFYDLTRTGAELRNVTLDAPVVRCRQALEAAKGQGVGVHAATVHRVEIFFGTLCAIALHGYDVAPSQDLGSALVRLAEEEADVVAAAARAQHEQTPRNLASLRTELLESIEVGSHVADLTAAALADEPARQLAVR